LTASTRLWIRHAVSMHRGDQLRAAAVIRTAVLLLAMVLKPTVEVERVSATTTTGLDNSDAWRAPSVQVENAVSVQNSLAPTSRITAKHVAFLHVQLHVAIVTTAFTISRARPLSAMIANSGSATTMMATVKQPPFSVERAKAVFVLRVGNSAVVTSVLHLNSK